MKIACQTITFGDDMNINQMPIVLEKVGKAGFQGAEIGFRRLLKETPETYAQLLEKNNLELVAVHIGGDFLDAASVARQMNDIPTVIKLCKTMKAKYVFLSGSYGRGRGWEDYEKSAENYNRIGKMLKEEGLTLCYHNHDWEIEGDMVGLRCLVESTDPEYMSFVPDVGWITVGGADPVAVLNELSGRIKNIHFKEFTSEKGFAELGKGIVDFAGVAKVAKTLEQVEWIVAEQDQSQIGAEESVSQNYQFIKGLIK